MPGHRRRGAKINALNNKTKMDKYVRMSESDESDSEANEKLLQAKEQPSDYQLGFRGNLSRPTTIKHLSPWTFNCLSRILVLFVMFLIAIGFAINRLPDFRDHHDCPETKPMEMHHKVYREAAVAAGQAECSAVGVAILKKGGNAVDSAIATLLCQGVLEPYFMGIGGGFGMTIYNKTTGQVTVIDAREKAYSAATRDMFIGKFEESEVGGKAVAVPGELKGYSYAYLKYGGGVSWEELFQPAIDKARNGFKASGSMEEKLHNEKKYILEDHVLCDVYCTSDKKDVKKEGDVIVNERLAKTLTFVQQNGVNDFYNGNIADDIISEIQAHGGVMTKEDLSDYDIIESEPFKLKLNNTGKGVLTFASASLPFGGPVLGGILSVMDQYKVKPVDFLKDNALYWHRAIEGIKHTYGVRYGMGDDKFKKQADKIVQEIANGAFARAAILKIDDSRTFNDPAYYGATFFNYTKSNTPTSTSHVSVLSPAKDAVSVTSTINFHFGAKFMSDSTGIVFNNEMNDFSIPSGEMSHDDFLSAFNLIEPGKRPLSSMAPSVFINNEGDAFFIIGAAGGITIPTSVSMAMLRLLYFTSEDFAEPIQDPRFHHQLIPNILYHEEGFSKELLDALKERGHQLELHGPTNNVNGVKNHGSHIHAYSDERNKGAGADGW